MALDENVVRLAGGKNLATVVTLMPNGQLAGAAPTWVDSDGDFVLVNTEPHRQRAKNLERDPRVTVLIQSAENPWDWAEVRGHVVEVVGGQEARDHIDQLSHKYVGTDYQNPIGPEGPHHPPHRRRQDEHASAALTSQFGWAVSFAASGVIGPSTPSSVSISAAPTGMAVEEALREAVVEADEVGGLLRGLDALGDARVAHHRRDRSHALHDRAHALLVQPRHEAAVDLHDVHREPLQVRERRVAGPEVVDRDPDAERGDVVDEVLAGDLVDQHRLRELQHQLVRREAASSRAPPRSPPRSRARAAAGPTRSR